MTSSPTPLHEHPEQAVTRAVTLLQGHTIAALTGAGISTDSGIPDYRGAGAPVRSPMTYSQFIADPHYRRRYWAGSQLGWRRFTNSLPNDGHRALVSLEEHGVLTGIVTQNVDGLHVRAGSRRVVDLHGSADRVRCLVCGQYFARAAIAERIQQLNPWLDDPGVTTLNPDGDAEVEDVSAMVVPDCSVCGGLLKPDIVFFGEFVPAERFQEARVIVTSATALLVVGSSLVVNSGIRFLEIARRAKLPIVIINRGATRGDSRASVTVNGGASEILSDLAERLTGQ
ncbi:Sir2 family NAD-dependent protein deacetylase [Rathayibacter toxicus]|uniref:protein acetyllysine N-acetyltransferase n=1 Tax=Rathayibacter toxicus TaxID=145458 RepID=A0A0C5BEH2_9MICO|nr:Sir2 family NAD-dependent protein deacetylase [Rathayibacter toxicus]AJM77691.1 NAD-dependent deacetylase [Rathayibacter toxicus]ALS58146.1 NAD-dependent deacetylase [Rathayibacter toxicus]KKM45353.1 NAD-dependent deacetylase [Rathayibacter toxicus]PPG21819.1 NAD-dependent deacetylase [Rathayibacter toxicus]PPG46781.1 NAD-dependent deacetylase [Rathayibacter toxicus]